MRVEEILAASLGVTECEGANDERGGEEVQRGVEGEPCGRSEESANEDGDGREKKEAECANDG